MVSSLLRKSITDLSRRRSRTFFAAATLALAVAGIGLFASPALMNRAMSAEVAADRLPDLTISTRPLVLDQAQLAALAAVPDVRAVEPRSSFGGRVYVGARRAFAQVLGIPDFTRQDVNVVHVASGAAPGTGAVLTDTQNTRQGLLPVQAGQTVQIIAADGAVRSLQVSGEGRNLDGGQAVTSDSVIVLYATPATVASLSRTPGYDELFFQLADTRPAAVNATIAAIRRTLATVPGFTGFSDLPQVRAAGDWPGKSSFQNFSKFLYIITLLALLSALVLISSTMTTLVAEQTRSVATLLVIALAVGTLLAAFGLVTAAANASRGSWGDHGEDVNIVPVAGRLLDARAEALIRATPGVAAVEPHFATDVTLDGKAARIWAVQQATVFHYRLAAGRWYTPAEEQTRAHVAVIEQDIAQATGTRLGDTISVQTAAGPASFRVIGISPQQQENGTALFVPLTTMHAVLTGMPADANDYWVQTTSHDHAFIDRTTTRIEDALTAHGYDVNSEIVYVKLANEIAANRTMTTSFAVVGLLIVAISMAGLANALTMSVLERTREIGILRSIGARARDIRRIFATETLTIATAGWLIGVLLGYLLDLSLVWLVKTVLNLNLTLAFPPWNLALTLAGTILLPLLITLLPIRHATHLRPGAALRYA
jgi:ABC-type lipoprotein release transport system permease subunit